MLDIFTIRRHTQTIPNQGKVDLEFGLLAFQDIT